MVEGDGRERAGNASRSPEGPGVVPARGGHHRGASLTGLALVLVLVLGSTAAIAADVPIEKMREWMFCNDAGWKAIREENYTYAEKQFLAGIKLVRPYQNKDQWLLAISYGNLARALYHQGRSAEAEPLAKWALEVRQKHPRNQPATIFKYLYLLARIEIELKHPREAEPLLRRALAIQEASLGAQDADLAPILDSLAGVLRDEKRYKESEQLSKRCLDILAKAKPRQDLLLAEATDHYAVLLRAMDRLTEAEFQEARARTIRDEQASAERKAEKAARARASQPKSAEFRPFK